MKCPTCGNADTKVVDSRVVEGGYAIRRRRECEYCEERFTTFERRGNTDLIVIKKDGTKELYDRMKIKKAFLLAFAKREISNESMEEMINQLEMQWTKHGAEIESAMIGKDIVTLLKEKDPVAYVRFASVYLSFNTLDDFKDIVK